MKGKKTMKNNKFFKFSLLILSLALVIGAVFAISASANEGESKPEIISQNIACEGDFHLMYAVDANTVKSGSVTLNVYSSYPDGNTAPIWSGTDTTAEEIEKIGSVYVFKTSGIAAADMAKNFYIQAVDGEGEDAVSGNVMRYSVAEYLYEKLCDPDLTPEWESLINSIIAFGDNAQIVFGKMNAEEHDLISELRYVVVAGGTLDGFTTGVYPVGKSITPYSETVSSWDATVSGVKNEFVSKENGVASFTVPETAVKVSFTATTGSSGGSSGNESTKVAETFNDYSAGDDISSVDGIIKPTTTSPGEFATDIERGTYVSIAPASKAIAAELFKNGAEVENATAYEVSFDLKINLGDRETKTNTCIDLRFRTTSSNTLIHKVTLYGRCGLEDNTSLVVQNGNGAGGGQHQFTGVDAAEAWVNIRAVMYKGDPQIYVYVNNDTEAYYVSTAINGSSGYDGSDISTLSAVLYADTTAVGATFCIDNYFCGYTTEAKPAE